MREKSWEENKDINIKRRGKRIWKEIKTVSVCMGLCERNRNEST